MTAYQLIDNRFGHTLHKVTALLFLLTRAAAEGVRVFAVSIVDRHRHWHARRALHRHHLGCSRSSTPSKAAWPPSSGQTSSRWSSMLAVRLWRYQPSASHVPGGWTEIHRVASLAGKFHLFHFAFNLTQSYTFWAGVIGGTFLTMASHGTDQLMVQRMLAAKNLRESRLALLSSGVVILMQFTLFLLIGVGPLRLLRPAPNGLCLKRRPHLSPPSSFARCLSASRA